MPSDRFPGFPGGYFANRVFTFAAHNQVHGRFGQDLVRQHRGMHAAQDNNAYPGHSCLTSPGNLQGIADQRRGGGESDQVEVPRARDPGHGLSRSIRSAWASRIATSWPSRSSTAASQARPKGGMMLATLRQTFFRLRITQGGFISNIRTDRSFDRIIVSSSVFIFQTFEASQYQLSTRRTAGQLLILIQILVTS